MPGRPGDPGPERGPHPAGWPPFCGAEYPGAVAGLPVICGRDVHPLTVRHRHDATGFQWWGFASYPRT